MARDKSKVCQKYVRKSMQKRGESGGDYWGHNGTKLDKMHMKYKRYNMYNKYKRHNTYKKI